MDKRIEEVMDYSLLIAQSYLLIRLVLSKNPYFKTPFFYFFIITGTLGCLSVVGFIICVRSPIPEDRTWLYTAGYAINIFGVMGSTVGKIYIVAHRYAVMRSVNLMENIWNDRLNYGLTAVLMLISCIRCISVFLCGYAFVVREGAKYVAMFDDQCNVGDKSQSSVTYFIFIVTSVILTILTSRQLYNIQRKTEAIIILLCVSTNVFQGGYEKVSVCTMSHLIKAIHQICWIFAAYFHLSQFNTILQATYVYPHYLATYSASITLVIFFPRVRMLLISRKDIDERSVAATTAVF